MIGKTCIVESRTMSGKSVVWGNKWQYWQKQFGSLTCYNGMVEFVQFVL